MCSGRPGKDFPRSCTLMKGPRPLELTSKTGLIRFLSLVGSLVAVYKDWNDIHEFLLPKRNPLNWHFLIEEMIVVAALVWFIMNELWRKEFAEHEKTKFDRDNLISRLSDSEKKRRTDVITGIPNGTQLNEDLDSFFENREHLEEAYVILIDVKDFGKVNDKFGYLKVDELLRKIAQDIYPGMRRNEDMYREVVKEEKDRTLWKQYRRYSGGDEFIFLLEGNQAAAIGFVVNRLVPTFNSLTKKTVDILRVEFPLSFRCAVVPVPKRDKAVDVFS